MKVVKVALLLIAVVFAAYVVYVAAAFFDFWFTEDYRCTVSCSGSDVFQDANIYFEDRYAGRLKYNIDYVHPETGEIPDGGLTLADYVDTNLLAGAVFSIKYKDLTDNTVFEKNSTVSFIEISELYFFSIDLDEGFPKDVNEPITKIEIERIR